MSNETPEEKARRIGVPLIPKRKALPVLPGLGEPTVAVCGECGIEIRQVMHYACMRSNCPVRA